MFTKFFSKEFVTRSVWFVAGCFVGTVVTSNVSFAQVSPVVASRGLVDLKLVDGLVVQDLKIDSIIDVSIVPPVLDLIPVVLPAPVVVKTVVSPVLCDVDSVLHVDVAVVA